MKDEDFFNNFDFCCYGIRNNVTLESNKRKGQVIMYDPALREFSIIVIDMPDAICVIDYCPYCGQKLPNSLREEHYSTIYKELGEKYLRSDEDTYDDFMNRLPEEFQTDEWWKKRGL